jgi:hypothetical protein
MSLATLLREQDAIATRAQLRAVAVTADRQRAHLDAGRWRLLNEQVICTHNGPLTWNQACWAVVLSAQGLVALCALTALQRFGVQGFETDDIHVLVAKGFRVLPVAGVSVVVHESRRLGRFDILPRLPPITGLERATIDAAVWSPDIKAATRVVVAPIQQRFTSPARLREALAAAGQVKFRETLISFIADLEGGAEALSEVAFLRWCRRHGFPRPKTQVRFDSAGRRRYLDATFELPNRSPLLVEIDGGIHLTLATRWADTAKDNDAMIANRKTLRFPSIAIYSEDRLAITQLREALGICPPQRGR